MAWPGSFPPGFAVVLLIFLFSSYILPTRWYRWTLSTVDCCNKSIEKRLLSDPPIRERKTGETNSSKIIYVLRQICGSNFLFVTQRRPRPDYLVGIIRNRKNPVGSGKMFEGGRYSLLVGLTTASIDKEKKRKSLGLSIAVCYRHTLCAVQAKGPAGQKRYVGKGSAGNFCLDRQVA